MAMSGNEDEVAFPDIADRVQGDDSGSDSSDTSRFRDELGGGVVDQPEPEPDPEPEPEPDPRPSVGGSSGGLGGGVVDQPDPDPGPSPGDVQDSQQPVESGAGEAVSSIDVGGDSQGADGAGVPDAPADETTDTVQGGSFRQAPEAVGGGQAPPSEAPAAGGSPLAGTDEAVGEAVDTAVETVEDSPVADVGGAIADASRGAAGFANRNVVSPAADFVGERVETGAALASAGPDLDADGTRAEAEGLAELESPFDAQPETGLGETTAAVAEAGGRGATGATLGAPAGAVETANIAGQGIEFTGEAVAEEGLQEGVTESGEAAVDTAQAAGTALARQAQQNPLQTGAALVGGLGGGAAVTPLRLTRTDVPTRGGGDTTVRGLRAEPPAITRPLTSDRNIQGRTLAGTTGGRPQVGTPTVDLENVDIERAGTGTAQSGAVFEPQRPFETDVFTASAPSAGETATERVRATQALLGEGDTLTGGAATQDVAPVADVLERTRELGEDVDTEAVADALAESDATVFGSGAVAAQAPEFRDPGDIDIVVPDKDAATERLESALAGSDTSTEAFDIKTPEDFGGLEGGEVFGFGRRSQDPAETPEGVGVNPIGEELQRKTGASAFFRGPDIGEEGVDVGPRPVRGAGTPTRQKDVRDAAAIAESMGADPSAVRQFREAFDLETAGATPPSGASRLLPQNLRALAADTRGQAGLVGAGRGGDVDLPRRPRDTGTEITPTPVRGGEPDRPRSPAVDGDSGRGVPVFSPGGGGARDSAPPGSGDGGGVVGGGGPLTEPDDPTSPAPGDGGGSEPSGLPDGPFGFGGGSTVPPSDPPAGPPSTPPSVPPGESEPPSSPPSSPPTDSPTGGGPFQPPGVPGFDPPSQPPRDRDLDLDPEDDEQPFGGAFVTQSDTFASGILSAEDVLDS